MKIKTSVYVKCSDSIVKKKKHKQKPLRALVNLPSKGSQSAAVRKALRPHNE